LQRLMLRGTLVRAQARALAALWQRVRNSQNDSGGKKLHVMVGLDAGKTVAPAALAVCGVGMQANSLLHSSFRTNIIPRKLLPCRPRFKRSNHLMPRHHSIDWSKGLKRSARKAQTARRCPF
jgi:hypothetical protein